MYQSALQTCQSRWALCCRIAKLIICSTMTQKIEPSLQTIQLFIHAVEFTPIIPVSAERQNFHLFHTSDYSCSSTLKVQCVGFSGIEQSGCRLQLSWTHLISASLRWPLINQKTLSRASVWFVCSGLLRKHSGATWCTLHIFTSAGQASKQFRPG